MEAWLIFIGVLLLVAFFVSGYISRQLSDKDTHNIQSQGIYPGSTQSSLPVKTYESKKREHHYRESQPDPFAKKKGTSRKKPQRVFRTKLDIKRAMILNEILKRKTDEP